MSRRLIQICTLLALLLLPAMSQAQFTYVINYYPNPPSELDTTTVTITGYTDTVPVVEIPAFIFILNGSNSPVVQIATGAFANLSVLSSVTIPDGVTNLGPLAFYSCQFLTNVVIGNGVTNIDDNTFFNCFHLTNATIGNKVSRVGNFAFQGCRGLSKFTLPDGVTYIGTNAFYGSSLTSVTVPSSVTNIGADAFQNCQSLAGAFFGGNAPSANTSVFSGDKTTVYYLPGTTGWSTTFGGRPTVLWNPQAQTGDGSFGVQSNQFGFNITGSSNLVIVVEANTNLSNPTWTTVGTNTLNTFTGTNGSAYFSDPQWTNYPGRFYRFRSP